jgi:2-amino-4-hydroxy-6-hydroxymethyldihydropteridine diphosphokinase
MTIQAWIGLGSNQGDREQYLKSAISSLEQISHSPLIVSSLYETEPWGGVAEGLFLNQVIGVSVSPNQLFVQAQQRYNTLMNHWDVSQKSHWHTRTISHFINPQSDTDTVELLMLYLLFIELINGRNRSMNSIRWDSRPLDLDILEVTGDLIQFDDAEIDHGCYESQHLTLPHPRFHERQFVLTPWKEVAPKLFISKFNATVADLQSRCPIDPTLHLYSP